MRDVLLYSGGMDSFIAAHDFPDAMLLYIDSGARYASAEMSLLHRNAPRHVVILKGAINLGLYERDDAIVPGRNLHLVALARNYASRVILSATAGGNSTDKDDTFARITSNLLSHIYSGAHFQSEPTTSVILPYKHMSKGEMVSHYLRGGHSVEPLLATLSCYDTVDGTHCGVCKACVRKYMALRANGILWHDWQKSPIDDYDWSGVIHAIRNGGWRCEDEDRYTLSILQDAGIAR